MVDAYLNEKFVGTIENKDEFIKDFRKNRRDGKIPSEINIRFDDEFNEVYIDSTKGRLRRPLILVENGKSKFTPDKINDLKDGVIKWNDLVEQGIIEYLDAGEEENSFISLYEDDVTSEHTHLEISPITMLGVVTSLVPYSNYGGSSRLIRGSKIQKQALGLYTTNFLLRMDTDASVLHYPQKPLVKSFMHDVFNYDENPSGQNLTIAVMSYEGYNMQDAIILNKGSIQRGVGRSTFFRPSSLEEVRYSGGMMDEVSIPDKEVKGYKSEKDYRYLEDDGIVYPEASLESEEVIIGRTSPPRFLSGMDEFNVAATTRRESSIAIGEGARGTVDSIFLTESGEGNRLIRVRMREQRIPEIGDKFASRHGQKGVIGLLVSHEDMPFSQNGITPDIIFSPHSVPSRMTVSHLLEIMSGKYGALKGSQVDATAFDTPNEKEVRNELLQMGFREDGTEVFYNGLTGERFKAKIYSGNIYYLKLKHMVASKLHARASGRIQLLTRQPVEGRAMGGGLRLGEMEKDCLVAHGASLLLKERFDSDKAIVHVCEECGLIGSWNAYKNKPNCPRCGENVKVSTVEMSYAFKLLLEEMKSMLVFPKVKLRGRF
jgi:DNA-directed RNA polymerase subunit B